MNFIKCIRLLLFFIIEKRWCSTPSRNARVYPVGMNAKTIRLLSGGPGTVLELTTLFYTKVFKDPILACLFESKGEEHPHRMCLFILDTCGFNKQYTVERSCRCGDSKYNALMQAHERAKSCPLRNNRKRKLDRRTGEYGGPFTESQKRHWLRHFFDAVDELELHTTFKKVFKNWLTFSMGKYAPFAPDRVDARKKKSTVVDKRAKKRKKQSNASPLIPSSTQKPVHSNNCVIH